MPYVGDLHRADIFLLHLSPGFHFTDYYAEWEVPTFRRRLIRNLRQELDGLEFPFVFLDPEFCWHPGFRWWEEKLRDVATTIRGAEARTLPRRVARAVAAGRRYRIGPVPLELVP